MNLRPTHVHNSGVKTILYVTMNNKPPEGYLYSGPCHIMKKDLKVMQPIKAFSGSKVELVKQVQGEEDYITYILVNAGRKEGLLLKYRNDMVTISDHEILGKSIMNAHHLLQQKYKAFNKLTKLLTR